jgi:hypothetical protein
VNRIGRSAEKKYWLRVAPGPKVVHVPLAREQREADLRAGDVVKVDLHVELVLEPDVAEEELADEDRPLVGVPLEDRLAVDVRLDVQDLHRARDRLLGRAVDRELHLVRRPVEAVGVVGVAVGEADRVLEQPAGSVPVSGAVPSPQSIVYVTPAPTVEGMTSASNWATSPSWTVPLTRRALKICCEPCSMRTSSRTKIWLRPARPIVGRSPSNPDCRKLSRPTCPWKAAGSATP